MRRKLSPEHGHDDGAASLWLWINSNNFFLVLEFSFFFIFSASVSFFGGFGAILSVLIAWCCCLRSCESLILRLKLIIFYKQNLCKQKSILNCENPFQNSTFNLQYIFYKLCFYSAILILQSVSLTSSGWALSEKKMLAWVLDNVDELTELLDETFIEWN